MQKNAVIFDLDGTLWNSCSAILPAWQKVIDAYGIVRPPLSLDELGSYMGKTVEQIAEAMLPMLNTDEAVKIMLEGCSEERNELRKSGAELYENVLDVLYKLSENYSLFIVSNSEDGYVQTFIEYYKLQDIITDFEMAGRTGKSKGENISLVMNRNDIEKAFYVGDTEMDMEAARFADIPFVFASYGFGKAHNPDFTITLPQQLIEIAADFFA